MFSQDDFDDIATEERVDEVPRYGSLVIGDGTTIVYDRDNDEAWIRSTEATDLEENA